MADLIGQTLGQYEITGILGRGGMATVYRARQTSIQRDVAIKVIEARLADDPEFLMRFEREAQMIASLNHAHILKVFDYGRRDDVVYLVMELLRGGHLGDIMRKGPLRLDAGLHVLSQIAPALDYAHHKGIIHRDLKPQNLMLDEARNVMLTDFGLAKLVNETTAMTQTGLTIGTPAYMSPEQWMSDSIDGRSDIYSLGVILFEMLTGKLPFSADTPYRMMYLHLHEPPPPLSAFKIDAPLGVDMVIKQALAKDRNLRFNTAAELVQALKMMVTSQPRPAVAAEPPLTKAFASAAPAIKRLNTAPLTASPPAPPAAKNAAQSAVPSAEPPAPDNPMPDTRPNAAANAATNTRTDSHGIAQVWVPAGSFMMGSAADPEARSDEKPQHPVQITTGFWLDQYPVTNIAFAAFIKDEGYTKRQYWSNTGWQWLTTNGIRGPGEYTGFTEAQHSRVGVSWFEADAYARWRGGRLPTEAQWEYAARGPQALIYPWGNDYQENYANVRGHRTKRVGSYPDGKSWVEAYDMVGNVWEWVSDWYEEMYYHEDIGPDPVGPTSGKTRGLRGGSWKHDKNLARAAARRHDAPSTRDDYIGFRVLLPADTK